MGNLEKYERDLAGIERQNRTLKKKKAQNKNYQNKIIQKIEERIKACDDLRKNRMILNLTTHNLQPLNRLL